MGRVVSRCACPHCGSSDAGAVYEDTSSHCHKCNKPIHRVKENQEQEKEYDKNMTESIQEILRLPITDMPDRMITKRFAQLYETRTTFDTNGEVVAHYYPYRDENNNIKAFKKKWMVEGKKRISVIGDFTDVELFSPVQCKNAKMLILTEGEDDAIAGTEMLALENKNYLIKSIQTGATVDNKGKGKLDKTLRNKLASFKDYQQVLLCFDNDAAGTAYAITLAEEIACDTKVKFVSFAENDVNDMLKAGKSKEFLKAIYDAREYVPDSIVSGADITMEEMLKPMIRGYTLPFPKLDQKMRGLRCKEHGGGEITTVCAGSGIGKTTLSMQIAHHMRRHEQLTIGNIVLEEKYTKTAQRYIALDNNVSVAELRENPDIITREAYEKSHRELVQAEGNYFMNHFGSLSSDSLLKKFNYLAKGKGCDLIILDNLSLVVAGQEGGKGGERKDIDMLMQNLAAFVTYTGVHIINVVHLKRQNRFIKKDKEGNIDPETAPFNRGGVISLDDLRGSAGLEQMSHNIWALEGDQYADNPNHRWLRILKCREWGEVGKADDLMYSQKTGIMSPVRF